LTVVGIGHLGLSFAVCLADAGHQVLGVDVDDAALAQATQGNVPFHEPGLQPLLAKNLERGRLRFTSSHAEAAAFGGVHFLCVGTPAGPDGSADLSFLDAAVGALAPYLDRPCLVVGRSTVPVGTARRVAEYLADKAPAGRAAELAWNPEFVREGCAVHDGLRPQRLVFGVGSPQAAQTLRRVYAQPVAAGVPVLVMSLESAELAKTAANAFLATRLSLINAVAEVCERAGADIQAVASALACEPRIGAGYLTPGLGYGGGCLPKDLRAFRAQAAGAGLRSVAALLGEVEAINRRCRERAVALASTVLGGSLAGRRIAVLGLAFKPGSDDLRDSASLDVCGRLVAEGAVVAAHDPVAMQHAARLEPRLRYARSAREAADGAELVMLLTDWEQYRTTDPAVLGAVAAQRTMIDARSTLDEALWRAAGWSVYRLGRVAGERGVT
jgi:UDPglucose 6-dehydrogenase